MQLATAARPRLGLSRLPRAPLTRCLQELQQQNARLLVVNRQLSQEAEATRAEAEAALRAENEAALRELGQEIEELRQGRLATEQVLQQVRGGWVRAGRDVVDWRGW